MHDAYTYDYAIVRVVPKVEREEFINVGAIVSCTGRDFLGCRIELDVPRLLALDPSVDVEFVKSHLATISAICTGGEEAGPIGRLSQRERFRWLVAPRSTVIQTSTSHVGRCQDPDKALEHLVERMVRTEQRPSAPAPQLHHRER